MDNIDRFILDKFIKGECTSEEEQKIQFWLGNPENQEKIKSMLEQHWNEVKVEDVEVDMNELLMSVRQRIFLDKPVMRVTRSRRSTKIWLRIAAVGTFFILCTSAFFLIRQRNLSQDLFVSNDQSISVNEPVVEELLSFDNQVTIKMLPDGTRVKLNSNSKLIYDQNFGKHGTREVRLEGEAFFDVVKNASCPFIVHTSGITVQVLGTAFNVKSYPEQETIETTLIHGKVSISRNGSDNDRDRLVLNPNQTGIYRKAQNELRVTQMIVNPVRDWEYSRLVFDDTPIDIFIQQLEERYNVSIKTELEDTCSITAEIRDESLEQVLNLLGELQGFTYTVSGSEVFIKGPLCKESEEIIN